MLKKKGGVSGMATWVNHLRIAENILKDGYRFDKIAFVTGTIAPDAGVPNEDWSKYDPPSTITHFRDENNEIHSEVFYDQHISDIKFSHEQEYYSFLMGYYVHLLIDIEWKKLMDKKKEEFLFKGILNKDSNLISKEVTKDSVELEFKYLRENKNSLFFTCFQHIVEVKDFLDFFPKGAFTNRFKHIREMYIANYHKSERNLIYLSSRELDTFIQEASLHIEDKLEAVC